MENNSKMRRGAGWRGGLVFMRKRERELENSPIHLTSSLYRGRVHARSRSEFLLHSCLKPWNYKRHFRQERLLERTPIVNECKTENTGRGLSPENLGRYKIRLGKGTIEVFGGRNCCCSPCPFAIPFRWKFILEKLICLSSPVLNF